MKTTCLSLALASLAAAQSPVPAVPAAPGEVMVPTLDHHQLAEPLRWAYRQTLDFSDELHRPGPVAYLGVSATPAPRELSGHLPVDRDTGLLVDVVAPDSPAAKAGLQPHDILTRLDDQILIHPRQLSVLVANRKEGDTVKLAFLRKGQPQEMNVVLGKKDGPAVDSVTGMIRSMPADVLLGHPDGQPLRTFVRRLQIPGGHGEVAITGSASAETGEDRPPAADADLRKQLDELRAMLETLQKQIK
jgi:membrane-associated protease RseP (regulator of RpoE activity)